MYEVVCALNFYDKYQIPITDNASSVSGRPFTIS